MTHPGYPSFMNNSAAWLKTEFVFSSRFGSEGSATQIINDFPKSLLHVARLEAFVVTPLKAEPQHWDPPTVNGVRVDLAVAVSIWDHLPTP